MDRLVRARILLAEAAALGVTIEDLIAEASSDALGIPSTGPTVAEYMDTVTPSFSKGTAATYKSYWRLLIDRLGERPIDSVGVDDCEAVVVDAVERARHNRPGSDGRSARESCIGALRALFARAERADLVTRNPAAQLEKPRRLPNRRRALDDGELREVIDAVRTTSQDPDLDLLLVRFHLESGARREGALNLRLRDLDKPRSTVWLREKFGIEREQPVSPSLLQALENIPRIGGRSRPTPRSSDPDGVCRSLDGATTPCSIAPGHVSRGQNARQYQRTSYATRPSPRSNAMLVLRSRRRSLAIARLR